MGLDMYLVADEYVSGWDHSGPEAQERYRAILGACGVKPEQIASGSPHIDIKYTVAYWRKANAIHAWFVDNVQDGKDECQESYVSRDDLAKLLATCKAAIAAYHAGDKPKVAALLPPRPGFFFGPTEINDDYVKHELEDTIEQVSRILDSPRWQTGVSFNYQSSW